MEPVVVKKDSSAKVLTLGIAVLNSTFVAEIQTIVEPSANRILDLVLETHPTLPAHPLVPSLLLDQLRLS
jgi:hypothetical protein